MKLRTSSWKDSKIDKPLGKLRKKKTKIKAKNEGDVRYYRNTKNLRDYWK